MFVIQGHVQHYAWGIPGGLNQWLPPQDRSEQPQAELWFGAHPNGPSPLVGAGGTLADVVSVGDVPLLVKVLAAKCPLSIQLHPDADLAARWFQAGSDLVSDPFAKEEMLVALEDFAVFAGWRALPQSASLLRDAATQLASRAPQRDSDASLMSLLDEAAAALDGGDIESAVRALLAVDGSDVDRASSAWRSVLRAAGAESKELASYELAAQTFPGDNGLLVLALLDHRVLDPHSAVYMPVGGVHAYSNGVGLEVMTASDNVLRLGLTGKRVAVDEALIALRADGDPHFLSGESQVHLGQESRVDYQPEAAAFHLTLLESGEVTLPSGRYRCVVNLQGQTIVKGPVDATILTPGQACAVLAREPDVVVEASGVTAAVADVRGHSGTDSRV